MAQFPSNIDLSSLNGTAGFKLSGEAGGDFAGASVASAGDVNGDGFLDLIVGAFLADPHGSDSGASYVVFGKASGFAANIDLSSLDGTTGFKLSGEAALDYSGYSAASAGDVNGDGFADLIVGASGADANGTDSGASYVVFGQASGFAANIDLSSLDGTTGFKLSGVAAGDYSGYSVGSAGDVNGDGFADLIIGAKYGGAGVEGASYVVFGKASGFAANIDLSSLDGTTGFKLSGVAAFDYNGKSVASAGDVNGDGFADLIIGAFGADPHGSKSGASYVVFGKASGFTSNIDLSTLDGTTGFKLSGVAANDLSGFSVASAGDLNGDGFADLIVGAYRADPNGSDSGASYVVFGTDQGFAANIDLSSLDGTTGFKLSGVAVDDISGMSVASAGDVNGDGFADLIVGAEGADPNGTNSGASYVVFGQASGFAANIDLSTLDGTTGFKLSGVAAYDRSGRAVASAGDVNGDGLADLIVGADGADASYVVFANLPDTAVNRTGTDASQNLVGGDFNDTLSGLGGIDHLYGHGGNDTLDGGAGDDTAVFSGDRADYAITRNTGPTGESFTVTDLRGGSPDGTDTLSQVEHLQFTDQTFETAQFPANIDLSSLNGTTGFKLSGEAAGDRSGASVASAGDVNGDGFADLIVGAIYADGNDVNSGAAYVVFGQASGFATNIDLSSLDGTTGFKLSGVAAGDRSGASVASAGDVNGDGFADLIVGAPSNAFSPGNSGASYVVFGKASGFAANIDLSSLNGTTGFKLSGAAVNDYSGRSVASAGDVNHDGFADLIVGANGADPNGNLSGASYVVFGQASGFAANIDLSSLDGSTGFKLSGVAADEQSGYSVASAGDVNGDGFADLIVGAIFASPNGSYSGASYVVFGKASGFAANLDLSTLDGTTGFKLSGVAAGNLSGYSVASAGDVNGDGFADLIVGAPYADPNGGDSGASYVVFGQASGFAANLDLSTLDGTTGFKLSGVAAGDYSGVSVTSAGDVNGDGFADLIVGARGVGYSGASYVVFGQAAGFTANIDLSSLDGSIGFKLSGEAAGYDSGRSVASAGDVNGDGLADLIVGARSANGSYVVFATLPDTAVNRTGTGADQNLVGGNLADTLSALGGDDTLYGHGGNDALDGGAGDDTAVFSGDRVDYSIVRNTGPAGESFTVTDLRGGSPDGTDTLSNVEQLRFSDQTFELRQFPANTDLSGLNGSTGFKLSGAAEYDYSGLSVASAGDVNGDGFADLIVGAPYSYSAGSYSYTGAAYVVFGQASGFAPDIDLSSLNGDNGFRLGGVADYDRTGFSVASAGDVNGDGFADMIVGAHTADPNGARSGSSYVVFGQAAGFGANLDLSSLNGQNGFKLNGEAAFDYAGFSVASAGDVNGDGFADLIIGANGVYSAGNYYTGASYVVFGTASGFAASVELSSLNGSNGFKLVGEEEDQLSGTSVASAGDVNGDGFADMIVGAPFAFANGVYSGAAYVVFGASSGFGAEIDLASLDGSNGFKLSGDIDGQGVGVSVASAGDVNGDGFADVIIGAPGTGSYYEGASFVVFGKASGFDADIDLSTLDGSDGFRVSGFSPFGISGRAVASAGDVNGDGFDDLIVGAPFASQYGGPPPGMAYVVFGKADGFDADINVLTLNGLNGFSLAGAQSYDSAGYSVSSAGDVNGDGLDDLMVGAYLASPNGTYSGASYVVFSQLPGTAVVRTGTDASQNLVGGNFDDVLDAEEGDDRLYPNLGHDTVDACDGNDTLIVNYAVSVNNVTMTISGPGSLDGHAGDIVDGVDNSVVFDNVNIFEITTGSGTDSILGGAGNDRLNGGAGADTMAGGAGDDLYFVDNAGDVVTEALNQGTDEIRTALASYSMAAVANVENLTGTSNSGQMLTGNSLANVITGGGGNDTLSGGAGADTLNGGLGTDTASYAASGAAVTVNLATNVNIGGDAAGDTLSGIENLIGSAQADTLTGDGNDNTLEGGAGADTLNGGLGTDTASYAASGAAVTVNLATNLNTGGDAAGDSLSGIENLTGSAQADTLTGDATANILNGGSGADTMVGGNGNDTYVVDNAGDVVTEAFGAGTDWVLTSLASYTLGANVENLVLTGAGAIDGTGNNLDNDIAGNSNPNLLDGGSGEDVLFGAGGADILIGNSAGDQLYGGIGNDSYIVHHSGAGAFENAGAGTDRVFADVSYAIGSHVENLVLMGANAIDGTGNDLDNDIAGNANDNVLDGGTGEDVLFGAGGDDTLIGNSAGDQLYGSTGNDTYIVHDSSAGAFENAGAGTDRVFADVSYAIGSHVEHLVLTGAGAIDGTGNNLDNAITGNANNNVLDGGTGEDILFGAGGDDTLIGNSAGDQLYGSTDNDTYIVHNSLAGAFENAGAGTDTVLADVSYILGSHIENITLTGAAAIDATGNNLDNAITGNAADNMLTGDGGSDRFVFAAAGTGHDTVTDFDAANASAGHDLIDFQGRGLNFAALTINQVGADTQILIGGDEITLKNVLTASVDAGDFLF